MVIELLRHCEAAQPPKQSRGAVLQMDCFHLAALGVAMTEAGVVKHPCVYIMASRRNGTLYIGATSNLPQRAYQHREGITRGFTARYGCKMLVWFEACDRMDAAIAREKQLKGGSRRKKLALIEAFNPNWHDLYEDLA